MPSCLIEQLVTWDLSLKFTRNIITLVLNKLQYSFKNIWTRRCDKIVEKELSKNITGRMKKCRPKRAVINPLNLTFPLISDNDNRRNRITQCEEYLTWVTLGSQYGNSWQNF